MATPAAVQAELSTDVMGPTILQAVEDDGGTGALYYVTGGTLYPGRTRWVVATAAGAAAAQAAEIVVALLAGPAPA